MGIEKALADAKRLMRERQTRDQPIVALVCGNPESTRLLGRQMSGREAMIGSEFFEALDGESEKQFHRRLCRVARERSAGLDRRVIVVSIGDDTPQPVGRYNFDGSLITVN